MDFVSDPSDIGESRRGVARRAPLDETQGIRIGGHGGQMFVTNLTLALFPSFAQTPFGNPGAPGRNSVSPSVLWRMGFPNGKCGNQEDEGRAPHPRPLSRAGARGA